MNDDKILYFFRHGETDWNKELRFQGRMDIPLNETGREQALRLRRFFAKHPVDAVLTSDLSRAVETARIAMGELALPIHFEPRIRETNLGDVEGMTHDEIKERFGAELIDRWRSIDIAHSQHRFPGGESKAEHLARILSGLEDFVRATEYKRIAVSTHGGVLRRFLHHLRPELSEGVMVGNCILYEVHYSSADGRWRTDLEAKGEN